MDINLNFMLNLQYCDFCGLSLSNDVLESLLELFVYFDYHSCAIVGGSMVLT